MGCSPVSLFLLLGHTLGQSLRGRMEEAAPCATPALPSPVTWVSQFIPRSEPLTSWLSPEGADSFTSKVPFEPISGASLNGCHWKEGLRAPLWTVRATWPCRGARPGMAAPGQLPENRGKGGGSFSWTHPLGKRLNSSEVRGMGL